MYIFHEDEWHVFTNEIVFRFSLVDTDMGRPVMDAAKGIGMEPLNVQQSVDAYLQKVSSPITFYILFVGSIDALKIDEAMRETLGGKFISYKGDVIPW